MTGEIQKAVYIVDDSDQVRDAIGMMLDELGIVSKQFSDAQSFIDFISDVIPTPGIALLDIRMPDINGLELQKSMLKNNINIPVIFITGHGDIPMAVEALKNGAVNFISKPFSEHKLLESINEAFRVLDASYQEQTTLKILQKRAATLTSREREVFERIAEGQANKVIAIELAISERTVEIHRSQVKKKMNARSLAELVRSKVILERSKPQSVQKISE